MDIFEEMPFYLPYIMEYLHNKALGLYLWRDSSNKTQ